MNRPQNRKRLLLLIALIFCMLQGGHSVSAQTTGFWETPQWIPGLIDTSPSQYPVILADPQGRIHVFHSQYVGGLFGILYTQWVEGVGWLQPVDILLPSSDGDDFHLLSAFLDHSGTINLTYWGGNEVRANIYFTQAPIDQAYKSTAWSKPQLIGPNASTPQTGDLTGDGNGFLLCVYGGKGEGSGLYSLYSEDGGKTWTTPESFYVTRSATQWPTPLQIYYDNQTIHAVWGLGDETGNSSRVSYAKFAKESKTWGKTTVIAEAFGYEADTPSIIRNGDSLILIYHNGFPSTRWMTLSKDNGDTWSFPTRLFEQVGSNGSAALVNDGSGQLHMFFGNRVGSPEIHGLWHSKWVNNAWTVPTAIVSGPQVRGEESGTEGFDPSFAQAVVSRGNLLFVAWRHDPLAIPLHIWYAYQLLDFAPSPIATQPKVQATASLPQELALDPTGAPNSLQPTKAPKLNPNEIPQPENTSTVILIGVIPVFLVIAVVLTLRYYRR